MEIVPTFKVALSFLFYIFSGMTSRSAGELS